jgi:hypothetical protein
MGCPGAQNPHSRNPENQSLAGTVSASIILGAPDLQGEVKSLCIDAIKAISWVEKVDITMAALPPQDELREASKKMATGLVCPRLESLLSDGKIVSANARCYTLK